jgi:rhamnosyltransferase subunit B
VATVTSLDLSITRHFVVITWGSVGDVHPFLGIATALKSRGNRVTFLTNLAFEELAVDAGLDFYAIGNVADAQAILSNPDLWHPRKGFELVWRSSVEIQKLIAEFLVAQPDANELVVIAHPLAMPGATTARDRIPGLKLVAPFLAPANLRTCHDPLWLGPLHIPRWMPHATRRWLWRRVDAGMLDPLTLPDINALRASYQLTPINNYAALIYDAADFSLTLFPEWFGPTMPDWSSRLWRGDFLLFDSFAAEPVNEELEQFLCAGDAPIVFTFGSAMQHAEKSFGVSLQTCLRLRRRGIFLTMFEEQIPANLPPAVKWLPYAPFRHLLPRAAAVVHHGGIGTTAEALRAGIPQIVVPMAHDQFDNGARVEALGTGVAIQRNRYRSGTVTKALAKLLASDTINARCRNIALHFSDPDPAQTLCEHIEKLL